MNWRPTAKPPASPAGIEIAGSPARLAGTVNKSVRYIAKGSLSRSPSLKGKVGKVGVKIKSTFLKENETKEKLCEFIRNSKVLSMGSECEKFEKNFAFYQGRKHCVFLNSGSSANLAIIQALINLGKIKQNDLIGFSALTWSTNVMPLIQLGLKTVPIDVELDTLNVSSRKLLYTLEKYNIKCFF